MHYNFEGKYGAKVPKFTERLKEFDEKLALFLNKMRKECTEEQRELIALYEEKAKQFSKVCSQEVFSMEGSFFQQEMLARSVQMLDDVLEGKDASENNKQCLLLARDMDRSAESDAVAVAFFGFLAVAVTVTAVVLAVTVEPIFLIFLLIAAEAGLFSTLRLIDSQETLKVEEVMTSFTDAGKSFFSDAAESEVDEPKKEAEKSSWWWPFGGNGGE